MESKLEGGIDNWNESLLERPEWGYLGVPAFAGTTPSTQNAIWNLNFWNLEF